MPEGGGLPGMRHGGRRGCGHVRAPHDLSLSDHHRRLGGGTAGRLTGCAFTVAAWRRAARTGRQRLDAHFFKGAEDDDVTLLHLLQVGIGRRRHFSHRAVDYAQRDGARLRADPLDRRFRLRRGIGNLSAGMSEGTRPASRSPTTRHPLKSSETAGLPRIARNMQAWSRAVHPIQSLLVVCSQSSLLAGSQ